MDIKREFNVNYIGKRYNIYDFLNNHPGGLNYLKPYCDKDVKNGMKTLKHSQSAYYLLREYKNEGRDTDTIDGNEDLEKLVDWDKPMLCQVAKLGKRYKEWVILPVDRKLRLFQSQLLENLTITPWYVVPIIWIPIIIYFTIEGTIQYSRITNDPSPLLPVVLCFLSGIILWTFLEYSLHRWVFHMEPSGDSRLMIYLHFAVHGLHHKVPFDSRRLVFPPLPAAVLAFFLYKIISLLLPESIIVLILAGGLTGYVIYDMIHFYLHYGSPKENTYLYYLKRYHNQHHFTYHNNGFGISSDIWDKVFGTVIRLRRLTFGIKW